MEDLKNQKLEALSILSRTLDNMKQKRNFKAKHQIQLFINTLYILKMKKMRIQ